MIEFYDLEILFNCVKKLYILKNKLDDLDLKNAVDLSLTYLFTTLQIILKQYEKENFKNE